MPNELSISHKLIAYLRAELGDPALGYAAPPAQLQGGFETLTYRFRLTRAPGDLSRPLVLRLYPPFYGTGNAIWESTVQNGLAEAGYPVARAHIVCTDMTVLGGAFFIMDHLPGHPLAADPPDTVPGLLGRAHAHLHTIDPAPVIEALAARGISEYDYTLGRRFDWLADKAEELPWVRQAVAWLLEHRPPEPDRLAVCHGDFHVLNILTDGGKVTGVLDWPGFALADPAYDVANSLVLITISSKHVAASMEGVPTVDWDHMAELYLAAYRTRRPLDDTHLDYYRARRCVGALIEGAEGQEVWQRPAIVRDLLAVVEDVTEVRITLP